MNTLKVFILSLALCGAFCGCERTPVAPSDAPGTPFTQEGVLKISALGPIEVFYPIPLDSPPHLTFPKHDWISIPQNFEQRSDGFQLNISTYYPGTELHWKAEGVRPKPKAGKTLTPFTQDGVIDVKSLGPLQVHYPIPFDSTPNLTFPKHDSISLPTKFEQRPDGFQLNILGVNPGSSKLHWKAQGMRATP